MNKNWPEKQRDLELARSILRQHEEPLDDEPNLESINIIQEGSICIKKAAWLIELEEHLESIHDQKNAEHIRNKLVSHFLIQGETIH